MRTAAVIAVPLQIAWVYQDWVYEVELGLHYCTTRSLGPQKLKFDGLGRMFCHLCQTCTCLTTFAKQMSSQRSELKCMCWVHIHSNCPQCIPMDLDPFQWPPTNSNGPQLIPTTPNVYADNGAPITKNTLKCDRGAECYDFWVIVLH